MYKLFKINFPLFYSTLEFAVDVMTLRKNLRSKHEFFSVNSLVNATYAINVQLLNLET